MTVANTSLASFLSALTATDRIPEREREALERHQRRGDRHAVRSARYRKWVLAETAYHLAHAAHWTALYARVTGIGDKDEANAKEKAAAVILLEYLNDFMGVPFINASDRKDRRVFIRKCGRAICTAGIWDQWRAAETRWMAQIGGAA